MVKLKRDSPEKQIGLNVQILKLLSADPPNNNKKNCERNISKISFNYIKQEIDLNYIFVIPPIIIYENCDKIKKKTKAFSSPHPPNKVYKKS